MKRFFIACLVFCVVCIQGFAQSDLQPVATVSYAKSEPITLKQLKTRCAAIEAQTGRTLSVAERKQVLDQLIDERLIVQAAEKEKISVSNGDVNNQFNQMISQQTGQTMTEAQFAQLVKERMDISLDEYMRRQNGMNVSDFKQYMKTQLTAQQYVMAKKSSELQNVAAPTDKEIRAFYELNKSASFTQSDILNIFIILAPKGSSEADAKKADALIQDLYNTVKNNPASVKDIEEKARSGDAGYQAAGVYMQKNAATARQLGVNMTTLLEIFEMKPGSVSNITENDDNFQFFIVQEKIDARILGLSDVVQPGTTLTVYEYIKSGLIAEAQNAAFSAAIDSLLTELRTDKNFQILKSDAELNTLLNW